ncbi:unnamed protein product [Pedinophyceae sp. YPF-701]|nr:unnamed protein product [Pedinophyceae sp. YPF-701]
MRQGEQQPAPCTPGGGCLAPLTNATPGSRARRKYRTPRSQRKKRRSRQVEGLFFSLAASEAAGPALPALSRAPRQQAGSPALLVLSYDAGDPGPAAALSFGTPRVGQTRVRDLQVRNATSGAQYVAVEIPSGDWAAAWGADDAVPADGNGAEGVEVPAGATVRFQVAWTPSQAGTVAEALALVWGAARARRVQVELRGRAAASAAPDARPAATAPPRRLKLQRPASAAGAGADAAPAGLLVALRARLWWALSGDVATADGLGRVARAIDDGRIALDAARTFVRDVGARERAFDALSSYHPLWLRAAAEVVASRSAAAVLGADAGAREVRALVGAAVLGDGGGLRGEFANPLSADAGEYGAAQGRAALLRTIQMVVALDRAVAGAGDGPTVSGAPPLFLPHSGVASSREVLARVVNGSLKAGGDLARELHLMGCALRHQQSPHLMTDLTVADLGADMRDGLRLCRLAEVLAGAAPGAILGHARLNARSRGAKEHNVGLALAALESAGLSLRGIATSAGPVDAKAQDVVDGNRERTLGLLWRAFATFDAPSLLDTPAVSREVSVLSARHRPGVQALGLELARSPHPHEPPMGWVQRWAAVTCAGYGVAVRNLSWSFADGQALCVLVHHYRPDLLPASAIFRPPPPTRAEVRAALGVSNGDDTNAVSDAPCALPGAASDELGLAALRRRAHQAAAAAELGGGSLLTWGEVFEAQGAVVDRLARDLAAGVRRNFAAVETALRRLGGVPMTLSGQDLLTHGPHPGAVGMLLCHLAPRLLPETAPHRAAARIQHAWRVHRFLAAPSRVAGAQRAAMQRAAGTIQRGWRAFLLRKRLAAARGRPAAVERGIVRMQAIVRGRIARAEAARVLAGVVVWERRALPHVVRLQAGAGGAEPGVVVEEGCFHEAGRRDRVAVAVSPVVSVVGAEMTNDDVVDMSFASDISLTAIQEAPSDSPGQAAGGDGDAITRPAPGRAGEEGVSFGTLPTGQENEAAGATPRSVTQSGGGAALQALSLNLDVVRASPCEVVEEGVVAQIAVRGPVAPVHAESSPVVAAGPLSTPVREAAAPASPRGAVTSPLERELLSDDVERAWRDSAASSPRCDVSGPRRSSSGDGNTEPSVLRLERLSFAEAASPRVGSGKAAAAIWARDSASPAGAAAATPEPSGGTSVVVGRLLEEEIESLRRELGSVAASPLAAELTSPVTFSSHESQHTPGGSVSSPDTAASPPGAEPAAAEPDSARDAQAEVAPAPAASARTEAEVSLVSEVLHLQRSHEAAVSDEAAQDLRETAATVIQSHYRGFAARRDVAELRRLRCAAREQADARRALVAIQAHVRGWLARRTYAATLAAREGAAARIQAWVRGWLVRRYLAERASAAEAERQQQLRESAATTIQGHYRGFAVRRDVAELRSLLHAVQAQEGAVRAVVAIQAHVRGWLARRTYAATLAAREGAAARIQAWVRGRLLRRAMARYHGCLDAANRALIEESDACRHLRFGASACARVKAARGELTAAIRALQRTVGPEVADTMSVAARWETHEENVARAVVASFRAQLTTEEIRRLLGDKDALPAGYSVTEAFALVDYWLRLTLYEVASGRKSSRMAHWERNTLMDGLAAELAARESRYRGFAARRDVAELRRLLCAVREQEGAVRAVVTLQAHVRGWLARRTLLRNRDLQRADGTDAVARASESESSSVADDDLSDWAPEDGDAALERAAVMMQEHLYGRDAAATERARTAEMARAAVVIQAHYRSRVARRAFARTLRDARATRDRTAEMARAAVVIQAHYRSRVARRAFARTLRDARATRDRTAEVARAAVVIQAHYRGRVARRAAAQIREERAAVAAAQRKAAAVTIQAYVRGMAVRRALGAEAARTRAAVVLQARKREAERILAEMRAVVTIQAHARGWLARRAAAAMRDEARAARVMQAATLIQAHVRGWSEASGTAMAAATPERRHASEMAELDTPGVVLCQSDCGDAEDVIAATPPSRLPSPRLREGTPAAQDAAPLSVLGGPSPAPCLGEAFVGSPVEVRVSDGAVSSVEEQEEAASEVTAIAAAAGLPLPLPSSPVEEEPRMDAAVEAPAAGPAAAPDEPTAQQPDAHLDGACGAPGVPELIGALGGDDDAAAQAAGQALATSCLHNDVSCAAVVAANGVPDIVRAARRCLRRGSGPHVRVLKLAFACLLGLARRPGPARAILDTPGGVDVAMEAMQLFRDDEAAFNGAAALIHRLAEDSDRARAVAAVPGVTSSLTWLTRKSPVRASPRRVRDLPRSPKATGELGKLLARSAEQRHVRPEVRDARKDVENSGSAPAGPSVVPKDRGGGSGAKGGLWRGGALRSRLPTGQVANVAKAAGPSRLPRAPKQQ